MDCEKFEATMLDELYGELDELTLAASKRHAAGCARCSALIAGLRATRKVVTLPVLTPSEGFEGRLLTAVHAAEARPTMGMAQVISWGGRWAMRPQTAMAAVFLLMLGTTSVLLSRRAPQSAVDSASSSFTVTENGAPASTAFAPSPVAASAAAPMDPEAAAVAHGTAPMAAPAPQGFAAKSAPAFAAGPGAPAGEPTADGLGNGSGERHYASKPRAIGRASDLESSNLGSLGRGAPAAGGGGGSADQADSRFAPPPPPAASTPAKDDGAFGAAKQQYREGDYPAAAQAFDGLAAGGDNTSGLWAARSVRDGAGGCGAAVARFDRIANAAWGTQNGYDAQYEAAQCYARIGQTDLARSRYSRLLTVPSYAARAQLGINASSQVAVKMRAKSAPAAPAAAPASPQASPPSASASMPTHN